LALIAGAAGKAVAAFASLPEPCARGGGARPLGERRRPVAEPLAQSLLRGLPGSARCVERAGRGTESLLLASASVSALMLVARRAKVPRFLARQAFEDELGVQAPCGFWDPLGFTDDGDMASYRRRRSVEFKHGRVAMLATLGYIVPEVGKWPGYLSLSQGVKFVDVPNGLSALSKVPMLGWSQILVFVGLVEYTAGFDDYQTGCPGDYGWKVLTSSDAAKKKRKLNADLANGRLAMFAIMAMLFQDGLTGSAWGDWSTAATPH